MISLIMLLDNRTPFQAERFVWIDREGFEHLVVVVKATYVVGERAPRLADEQPLIHMADEHYGDPGATSVRYESECTPPKPRVDVVVVGSAYAARGREVEEMDVELWVGTHGKRLRVFGDRVWGGAPLGYRKSSPKPFSRMPLVYERAFGGTDASHQDPEKHVTDLRNPIGCGFHAHGDPKGIVGTPLPNVEDPRELIVDLNSRPTPVGFGCVPRGSLARIRHAGTYDQQWLNERFPFLPDDFDRRYFQCAPDDQQFGEVSEGELVRCLGMAPDGEWQFRVPGARFPIEVLRRHGEEALTPQLGTLLVEPDRSRCSLVWHASVPVRGKVHDILRITVGHLTPGEQRARRTGKHYFSSVSQLVEWQAQIQLEAEL